MSPILVRDTWTSREARDYLDERYRQRFEERHQYWSLSDSYAMRALLTYVRELEAKLRLTKGAA